MPRGQLVNSIQSLQIEWATHHAERSVRDFIINEKKLTERQYRYILGRAPLLDWTTRRDEIQNKVAATKIQNYSEKASDTHAHFLTAARLALLKSIKLMNNPELKPSELLACISAAEKAQTVFIRAMGVNADQGLIQIYQQVNATNNTFIKNDSGTSGTWSEELKSKMTYEDIKEIIEMRREQKRHLQAQTKN